MSAMTWDEFEALINNLNANDYSRDADANKRKARYAIQTVFLAMDRKAQENDTLRQMLVDLGIENARLSIDLEQQRTRADAKVCPYHPDGGEHPGAAQPADEPSPSKKLKPSTPPEGATP